MREVYVKDDSTGSVAAEVLEDNNLFLRLHKTPTNFFFYLLARSLRGKYSPCVRTQRSICCHPDIGQGSLEGSCEVKE